MRDICEVCKGTKNVPDGEHFTACAACLGTGEKLVPDMTFTFASSCGHTYEVDAIRCSADGPCNCGEPWAYFLKAIQCPPCQYKPKFFERPLYTHLGAGLMNAKGLKKLEITR